MISKYLTDLVQQQTIMPVNVSKHILNSSNCFYEKYLCKPFLVCKACNFSQLMITVCSHSKQLLQLSPWNASMFVFESAADIAFCQWSTFSLHASQNRTTSRVEQKLHQIMKGHCWYCQRLTAKWKLKVWRAVIFPLKSRSHCAKCIITAHTAKFQQYFVVCPAGSFLNVFFSCLQTKMKICTPRKFLSRVAQQFIYLLFIYLVRTVHINEHLTWGHVNLLQANFHPQSLHYSYSQLFTHKYLSLRHNDPNM